MEVLDKMASKVSIIWRVLRRNGLASRTVSDLTSDAMMKTSHRRVSTLKTRSRPEMQKQSLTNKEGANKRENKRENRQNQCENQRTFQTTFSSELRKVKRHSSTKRSLKKQNDFKSPIYKSSSTEKIRMRTRQTRNKNKSRTMEQYCRYSIQQNCPRTTSSKKRKTPSTR